MTVSTTVSAMSALVPPRFLFRWAFAVPHCPELPGDKPRTCLPLPERCRLPDLAGFDGHAPFAELLFGWNERGLGVGLVVHGRKLPAVDVSTANDGLHLRLDTRCTQTVHRATKFCHAFHLRPRNAKGQPGVARLPIPQAREEPPVDRDAKPLIQTTDTADGYRLDAWFPAAALYGYDPASHARLGFYAVVEDQKLGTQPLTVDDEFPIEFDPSLWQTLELVT